MSETPWPYLQRDDFRSRLGVAAVFAETYDAGGPWLEIGGGATCMSAHALWRFKERVGPLHPSDEFYHDVDPSDLSERPYKSVQRRIHDCAFAELQPWTGGALILLGADLRTWPAVMDELVAASRVVIAEVAMEYPSHGIEPILAMKPLVSVEFHFPGCEYGNRRMVVVAGGAA